MAFDLDVAIVGGGIAGLRLAIGLLNHKIKVAVYERAFNFGEIGAGVSFHPNAVRAMDGIDPRVTASFYKVANTSAFQELRKVYVSYRTAEGPNAGKPIARPECPGPHGGAHRARFLDELIKLVPKDVAHFGKKVTEIDESNSRVRLSLEDGTFAEHDCAIGCDGIHSVVRRYVLGPDDPAAVAGFSGGYCHRGLIPMGKAISLVGKELALNSQSHLGHGAHLLTFPVDDRQTLNGRFIPHTRIRVLTDGACSRCVQHLRHLERTEVGVPGFVKDIHKDFEHFGAPAQTIIKQMENTDIWALFDHLPAKTFFKGHVVIIGDAAHATTPYQGNGAGFAIEDAYVLSVLLASIKDADQIGSGFQAFDRVRRERGLKLVQTSREAGALWNMMDPQAGDDLDKIEQNTLTRFDWIWAADHEADIQSALTLMEG